MRSKTAEDVSLLFVTLLVRKNVTIFELDDRAI